MKTKMTPYHRRTIPIEVDWAESSADEARSGWPRIMHTVMTGACNEHRHDDKVMTADTVTVADDKSVYTLGVMSVHTETRRDMLDDHMVIRYVWKVNGVPVRALEFNATKEGRLGRLVAEYNTTIGKMERTEFKK